MTSVYKLPKVVPSSLHAPLETPPCAHGLAWTTTVYELPKQLPSSPQTTSKTRVSLTADASASAQVTAALTIIQETSSLATEVDRTTMSNDAKGEVAALNMAAHVQLGELFALDP
mmetsp:Transcript_3929/g.9897  ORF Transcript_3929/g.9897 Transcript_3929/m.9897 type:complete len:115 (+) Transcript_3929:2-346(+)